MKENNIKTAERKTANKKPLMSNRAMNCSYSGSADPWGSSFESIIDSYREYMGSKSWD